MSASRLYSQPVIHTLFLHRALSELDGRGAMPAYDVIVIANHLKENRLKLSNLLTTVGTKMMDRGAVVTEIKNWGNRDLAYRIRQKGVNHYRAQYMSIDLFCSPATLNVLQSTLRASAQVLRIMSIRKPELGRDGWQAREAREDRNLAAHGEDAAVALDAAKYEYRNLVMQRIFEGKTKQELLADALAQHRLASLSKSRELTQLSAEASRLRSEQVELPKEVRSRMGSPPPSYGDEEPSS